MTAQTFIIAALGVGAVVTIAIAVVGAAAIGSGRKWGVSLIAIAMMLGVTLAVLADADATTAAETGAVGIAEGDEPKGLPHE